MIKNSLKNYIKCLAHVFVPLGCLFLGVLFGAYHLIGVISAQLSYLAEETVRIIPEVEADFDELWAFVLASARELSWKNPFQTISLILDGWLAEKIGTFTGMTAEQYAKFVNDIQTVLQKVGEELRSGFSVFIVYIVLSVWLGYFVTNLFVRRSTVKRGLLKLLAVTLLDSLFSATLIAFTTWLLSVWSPGALISAVISMIVVSFVSLMEAYLLHGRGKVELRRVVSLKNCCLLQLSQLIILLISVAVIVLFFLITNALVALAIGFAVATIALLVSGVNAESYVVSLAKSQPLAVREAESRE